jgi:hypothetical protein
MNYRIIEKQSVFLIQSKKAWYTRWKYVKQKGSTVIPRIYETKRGAQSAINILKRYV